MTPIMKRTEKDDAVSPVVGVMLMLVVTIIIAAVVAAFASGVTTQTEAAPNAILKVTADSTWTDFIDDGDGKAQYPCTVGSIFITSVNGQDICEDKLKVIVSKGTTTKEAILDKAGEKEYLTAGATINVAYKSSTPIVVKSLEAGKSLDDDGTSCLGFSTGDRLDVKIVYDETHVLFNQQVTAL